MLMASKSRRWEPCVHIMLCILPHGLSSCASSDIKGGLCPILSLFPALICSPLSASSYPLNYVTLASLHACYHGHVWCLAWLCITKYVNHLSSSCWHSIQVTCMCLLGFWGLWPIFTAKFGWQVYIFMMCSLLCCYVGQHVHSALSVLVLGAISMRTSILDVRLCHSFFIGCDYLPIRAYLCI